VKDADSGNISSLTDAISVSKIVDAAAGRMLETSTGKSIDLLKAHDKGYILAAEARVSTLLVFFMLRLITLYSLPRFTIISRDFTLRFRLILRDFSLSYVI
jgi:hypothetical protein